MKYENIPVDESTGRLLKCIKCENEEIDINAKYCKICGAEVVNSCSNEDCKTISSGNARFCLECGAETLFYTTNMLKPWGEIGKEFPESDNTQNNTNKTTKSHAKKVVNKPVFPTSNTPEEVKANNPSQQAQSMQHVQHAQSLQQGVHQIGQPTRPRDVYEDIKHINRGEKPIEMQQNSNNLSSRMQDNRNQPVKPVSYTQVTSLDDDEIPFSKINL